MKYYHALYMNENIEANRTDIITKIKHKQWQFNKYLIVLSDNENNHLEFFDSVFLLQNIINEDRLFVIGIAEGYEGAVEMIQKITEEVYERTKNTDIRNYLLKKEQEHEESSV